MQPPQCDSPGATVSGIRLHHYPLLRSGKVRDLFDLGDELLIVATDRVSAFDVVLPTAIPDKGKILTAVSEFWFGRLNNIVPVDRVDRCLDDLNLTDVEHDVLEGRSVIVRKARRIDIECVVRGYLVGSGWNEYRETGALAGEPLTRGLRLGDRLPSLRFTPAIKNDEGHDQNIHRIELARIVGEQLAGVLQALSLQLFQLGTRIAGRAGFILADSKFEFGMVDGELTLIDEALTPDSSRYWDTRELSIGSEPPSFDKQIIRDWLESTPWDKSHPGPELPMRIVEETRWRYLQVLERLTRSSDDGVTL